jgi:hypothetical protein
MHCHQKERRDCDSFFERVSSELSNYWCSAVEEREIARDVSRGGLAVKKRVKEPKRHSLGSHTQD